MSLNIAQPVRVSNSPNMVVVEFPPTWPCVPVPYAYLSRTPCPAYLNCDLEFGLIHADAGAGVVAGISAVAESADRHFREDVRVFIPRLISATSNSNLWKPEVLE